MISERDNMAATYKAQGEAEAKVIRNSTDQEVELILSDAEKNSEIIRAEGDAQYMKILADAYNDEDKKDFYSFIRSLDALKASMQGENKTIILDEHSNQCNAIIDTGIFNRCNIYDHLIHTDTSYNVCTLSTD